MSSNANAPITSRGPRIEFTSRFVQPPGELYITQDDGFTIRFASSQVGTTLRLLARVLVVGEGVKYWQQTVTVTLLRGLEQREFVGLEGFLLGFIVDLPEPLAQGSWAFAAVELTRGIGTPIHDFQALAHGYVTAANPLIWPGGLYPDPTAFRGTPTLFNIGDPAAGANVVDDVPSGARWRIQSATMRLVTSVTVANRRMVLEFQRSTGQVLARAVGADTVPASQTAEFSFAPYGFDAASRDGFRLVAIPSEFILDQTDVIATAVVNLQAGDQISMIRLSVEEWFSPQTPI